jgi:FlaA1/EpsC-like NDP-sugar epimerase
MGSRGSVIPLFKKQAEKGDPITITHPEMTRFLLTLDESVSLVLHAIEKAKGGEIFVKKAPASNVTLIADAIISWIGADAQRIPKIVVGIRPGEKIHEVLVNEYEIRKSVESEGFFVIEPEYHHSVPSSGRPPGYEYTSANTQQIVSIPDMVRLLQRMGNAEFYS